MFASMAPCGKVKLFVPLIRRCYHSRFPTWQGKAMKEAIRKAEVLIEAHQYIREFSGTTVVVKVGGSIMDDPQRLTCLLEDVCFLRAVGLRPLLVHGGGKRISEAMDAEGIDVQFVHGRRYTDERTLAIAEHVLVNDINQTIVDQITTFGQSATPLHSLASCVIFAERLFLSGDNDRKIDIGLVGEVKRVNTDLLGALLSSGYIPVLSPIARDAAGGKLNCNADSVAGQVAAALDAEKLVLVSDTHGIRTGEDEDSLASHLTGAQIQELVASGVINEGMLPKTDAALVALEAGVRKAHVIDGRISHSLLLEIFSSNGIGTEIVLES
jgi:acetylglutamate kinase